MMASPKIGFGSPGVMRKKLGETIGISPKPIDSRQPYRKSRVGTLMPVSFRRSGT